MGLGLLVFKFRRVVFVIISFELLFLGVLMALSLSGSLLLLLVIWLGVVSSCFILAFLVGLVKSYGRDCCYF